MKSFLGELFLVVLPGIGGIICLLNGKIFWFVGSIIFILFISSIGKNEIDVDEFRSDFYTEQMNKNGELINVLYRIGSPDLPSGDYSDEKKELWKQYHELETEYNNWSKEKTEQLIEMEGYY